MRAVSLERLHLCCRGSCEFVESSLRTVLLRILTTVKFLISAKTENRSTARFYNFQKWKHASLSTRPRIHARVTVLFDDMGRGDHLWALSGWGQLCLLFVVCLRPLSATLLWIASGLTPYSARKAGLRDGRASPGSTACRGQHWPRRTWLMSTRPSVTPKVSDEGVEGRR